MLHEKSNKIGKITNKKFRIWNLHMSAIQLIVGNFNVNVWTQPGQDFKFQAPRHHYLNLAVVPSMKILSFIQLIRDREKVYVINCNMNKCHWHSPMRKQLERALEMWKAICQPFRQDKVARHRHPVLAWWCGIATWCSCAVGWLCSVVCVMSMVVETGSDCWQWVALGVVDGGGWWRLEGNHCLQGVRTGDCRHMG